MKYYLVIIFITILFLHDCGLFNADDEPEVPSPIPGKIVFSMPQGEGESSQIFVMNPNGTGLKQLTDLGQFDAVNPSWSPDGTQIVFTTGKRGTVGNPAIHIMNADGSNIQPLKVFPERPDLAFPGRYPKWSPDGTKIVFHQCIGCGAAGGNNYEIFVYDFLQDTIIQITDHPAVDRFPDWNKDSNEIAFLSNRESVNTNTPFFKNIFISNIDKEVIQQITFNGKVNRPSWNRNSYLLAFTESEQEKIFLVNTDTNKKDSLETPIFFLGLLNGMLWETK